MKKIKAFIKSLFSKQPQFFNNTSWFYFRGKRTSMFRIVSEKQKEIKERVNDKFNIHVK